MKKIYYSLLILHMKQNLKKMGNNNRILAEEKFNRESTYLTIVDLLINKQLKQITIAITININFRYFILCLQLTIDYLIDIFLTYERGVNVPIMAINNINGKIKDEEIVQYVEDIYIIKFNEIYVMRKDFI